MEKNYLGVMEVTKEYIDLIRTLGYEDPDIVYGILLVIFDYTLRRGCSEEILRTLINKALETGIKANEIMKETENKLIRLDES